MNRQIAALTGSLLLLIPAIAVVSGGLLEFDVPRALVHPVLVMGGLCGALLWNALLVMKLRVGMEGDYLIGSVSIRVRGVGVSLATLAVGGLLLATITAYLFVENFQPRQLF